MVKQNVINFIFGLIGGMFVAYGLAGFLNFLPHSNLISFLAVLAGLAFCLVNSKRAS